MTTREAVIAEAACPTCGSPEGQPCATVLAGGRKVRNHPARVRAAIVVELEALRRDIDERLALAGAGGCKCGQAAAEESHPCPYQADVNGDDDPEYCRCCDDCRGNCRDDI